MAESSDRERPPFGPIQINLPKPPYHPYRSSYESLALIQDPTFDPYLPYTWGFTIYRVRFEGDSDERFAQALQRFTQWSKWIIRASRYSEMASEPKGPEPPATGGLTDYLADRFYNDVIELDPGVEVITGPEGQENFSTIGQEFSNWIAGLKVDLGKSENTPRYNHCLIIDKNALKSLELLPDTLPPLEYGKINHPKDRETFRSYCESWVWVLDRKSCKAFLQGQEMKYPPWLRLYIGSFLDICFERAQREIPAHWQGLAQEDSEKWETVRWWSSAATMINKLNRQRRAPGYVTVDDMIRQQKEKRLRELEKKKEEQ